MNGLFDPAAIEKKIDGLLRTTGGALKRSSLLTLVIVHPQERQAEVAHRLDYVFGRRPLRVIRIETGHDTPTTVDVSARCQPHQTGQEVCFQEIVFYSGPDGSGLNPALWQPLVIRDLPVVLFSLEEVSVLKDILGKMDFSPDKCLVDSGTTDSSTGLAGYLSFLSCLDVLVEKGTAMADLTWRALTGYRLLIARLFDDADPLTLLQELSQVELGGLPLHDSLLLALWLAARLGWKDGRLKGETLSFFGVEDREITLSLSGGAESRFSIVFKTVRGEGASLRRMEDTIVLLTAGGTEQRKAFSESGCDQCLLEEIDRLSPDRTWKEVLALAQTVKSEE